MSHVADFLLRYPRVVTAQLVVLSLAAGLYLLLGGVRFDYSLERFLPPDDPSIQAYQAFVDEYESDDAFIAVGFEADDVFAYEVLRDVEAMTAALDAVAGVEEVVSLTALETLRGTADGLEVAPVGDDLAPDPVALATLEARVRSDSLTAAYVVNAEGDATALLVRIDPVLNRSGTRGRLLTDVEAALAPWADRYDFRWSGFPYLRYTTTQLLRSNLLRSVGLIALVIVLVLAWMFRNVRGVVLPLAAVALGLLWTIASMMLLGSTIDVMAGTLAAIILVVGVADAIHLLAKYYDGLAAGLRKRAALRQMVVRLGAATLLTSATTAIGFGTLATSELLPIQRFGLFTALGVMLTFAISLALLASVLAWMRTPKPQQIQRLGRGGFTRGLRWVDGFAERHARGIVIATLVLCGAGVLGAMQLRVNSYVNDDLGPETRVYQDIRFFEDRIVSPFRFEVVLTADEPDAFKDPELLRTVEQVQRHLQAQPHVQRVVSPADLLKQLNRAMRGDSAEAYRLPESRDLTAQYLFLLELTDEAFVHRFVTLDYSAARLSANVPDVGSREVQRLRDDVEAFLTATLPPGVEATTTGVLTITADIVDDLVRGLLLSIGLAFVFISLLMGFLFRDVKLVLISLVPNVVPLLLIAGLMGALGIEIKPATAVVFSIAFGIAVDDSIHVLARLRQEMRAGTPLREAITATILGTGKAVVLTSIVLFGGFIVLTTSTFQSTTDMGLLLASTTVLAVLADLFLLPALLHLAYPERKTGAEVVPQPPAPQEAVADRPRAAAPLLESEPIS